MTVQEQIEQIANEAKAKIDELVKLQEKQNPIQAGDWCKFWDGDAEPDMLSQDGSANYTVGRFEKYNSDYFAVKYENGTAWEHCRKLTPEDLGFSSHKPSWKDAPEEAQYLAQDENGRWLWFATEPWINRGYSSVKYWCTETGHINEAKVPNWDTTLERRPE